jgi:hypothetical protein
MGPEPDYSREALARFIEFVVEKGLVNPSTAQAGGLRRAKCSKSSRGSVGRRPADRRMRCFAFNRNPGRLSPCRSGAPPPVGRPSRSS